LMRSYIIRLEAWLLDGAGVRRDLDGDCWERFPGVRAPCEGGAGGGGALLERTWPSRFVIGLPRQMRKYASGWAVVAKGASSRLQWRRVRGEVSPLFVCGRQCLGGLLTMSLLVALPMLPKSRDTEGAGVIVGVLAFVKASSSPPLPRDSSREEWVGLGRTKGAESSGSAGDLGTVIQRLERNIMEIQSISNAAAQKSSYPVQRP